MDNYIRIFDNPEFGSVRTVKHDGQVYFVGKDVAEALGYSNSNDALKRHCRGVVKHYPIVDSLGRNQYARVISEPDMYRLIVNSKLPGAERFESWVMEEVLPSIRRTGGYMTTVQGETPEQTMARALLIANDTMARQASELEAMRPKALFADAVNASTTTILIGDFAKLLRQNGIDIGQNRLFKWLRENGYLISRSGDSWNMPTQRSMDMQLFEVKERTHNSPDGTVIISKTTKLTGKGQTYFINRFLGERDLHRGKGVRL